MSRLRALLLPGVVLLSALALWQPVVADEDTWGHVLFGRHFVHQGLPETNTYSFVAADWPWIKHEWAFQALMGACWEALGGRGLVLLKAALVALLLVVLVPALHRARDAEATAFLLLAVLPLACISMLVRPQLATFVLAAALIRLLSAVIAGEAPLAVLLALPPVFALWANVHGGFLVGLGLIGLAGCLVALARVAPARAQADASPRILLALVLALASSAAATLLNPAGTGLWGFLAHSLRAPPRFVTEWHPLHRMIGNPAVPPFLLVLALSLALLLLRRPIVLTLSGCAFAVFAFATFFSIRHLALAAVAGSLALSEAMPDVLARMRGGPRARTGTLALRAALGLLAVLQLARVVPAMKDGALWLRVPDDKYPEAAVDAATSRGITGNAVVFYDWGGYVLFRAWPHVRVDIDSRCDTAYPLRLLEEAVAAAHGRAAGLAMLDRTRPDLVIMPPGVIETWGLFDDPAWQVVHADSVAVLLVPAPVAVAMDAQRGPWHAPVR